MANFYATVSADQIVDEIRDNDEEMGEVVALIARQVERMDDDGREVLRDVIRMYGAPPDLRVMASLLVQVANEMEG
jgi:hypothetical protein